MTSALSAVSLFVSLGPIGHSPLQYKGTVDGSRAITARVIVPRNSVGVGPTFGGL